MNDLSEVSNYLQNNNFIITIQPKQNFHYRYVKELKTSHGFLMGQQRRAHQSNPTTSNLYPSVKLVLPKDGYLNDDGAKRDFYILCTLHNNDDKCLSPYLLLAKGETKVNYNFIFEKMKDNPYNVVERYWELKEYVIARLKTEEFKKSLEEKTKEYEKLQLPMEFRSLKGDLDLNNENCVKNSGNLNVCLGFTVFEKDSNSNTYRLYKETIFSNNIYHGDDLKIHEICNTEGSILGGIKITMLIKLISKFPLSAVITRIDKKTKKTNWRTEIPIKKEDIFGNHAISFDLPPYKGPRCTDKKIEVNIEIVATGTTYKSSNVKFYYLNNCYENFDNPPSKRARNSIVEELKEEVLTSTSSNNDSRLYFTPTPDLNTQSEGFMITPSMEPIAAIPSITNYEPNPDLGITSIIDHTGTNDFSDDANVNNAYANNANANNLNYNNEYYSFIGRNDLSDVALKSNNENANNENANNGNANNLNYNNEYYSLIGRNDLSNVANANNANANNTNPNNYNFKYYNNMRNIVLNDIANANNSNTNTFNYNIELFNNEFEFISESRTITQHEDNHKNNRAEMLPLHHEVIGTSRSYRKIDRVLQKLRDATDIDIMDVENEDGNTIFHEALLSPESFMHLYNMVKNSAHRELVRKARNKNRENLLHYACQQNKAMCIPPLIDMGCYVHEQDNNARTPLHIAMEHNYTDCILRLQELLKDHSKYPEDVRDSFIKMFKVYNHNGHTVLHDALLQQRSELLETMFEFCRIYKINPVDCNILSNGDSIVHLVVKNNLIEMVKLIQKYIPYYLTIENYAGISVLDLPNISEEMLQALCS